MYDTIDGWLIAWIAGGAFVLTTSASWEQEHRDSGDHLDDWDFETRPPATGLWVFVGAVRVSGGSYYYPNDVDVTVHGDWRRPTAHELWTLRRHAPLDIEVPDDRD